VPEPVLPVAELAGGPSVVRSRGAEAFAPEAMSPVLAAVGEAVVALGERSGVRRQELEVFLPVPARSVAEAVGAPSVVPLQRAAAVPPAAEAVAVPSAGRLLVVEAFAPEGMSPVLAAVGEVAAVLGARSAVRLQGAEAFGAEAATPGAEVVAVLEAPSAVRAEGQDSARPAIQRRPWVEYWVGHV
jgi:hypothetical protein